VKAQLSAQVSGLFAQVNITSTFASQPEIVAIPLASQT